MGVSSSIMEEQELNEFRKLNPDEQTDLELPVPPAKRQVTDKKGFVIFGILMLILVPFMIYTLVKSDIRRLKYGQDSCGNLCGIKNSKIEGIECSGKDYTNMPYMKVNIRTDEKACTDECPPGYVTDDNSCYVGDPFTGNVTVESVDFWVYSLGLWWKFLIIFLITTVLCSITLILFRYFPGVIVWSVSIISLLVAITITGVFWWIVSKAKAGDENKPGFVALALISTLFTIVIIILFILLFRKLQLIILLYRETTKAMFAMPMIMFLPIATLIIQLLVLALLITTTIYMGTSAELTKIESSGFYFYERNGVIKFTMIFNMIVTIWALQFLAGCQYMVIAGSVGQWFFKKDPLHFPIITSFTNTLRFHLGTIAFGSFIITLMAVIKALIKSLVCNSKLRWLIDCCCGNIEALLKFLSKNAYVETAIYGQPFLRSGKRAAKLLITNAGSVIAVNSVGDFILAMTQFLLLVISTAIAYGIFLNESYVVVPTVLAFILNLIIVAIVFSVFETIVDTLFICFCEDTALNDGSESNPYYMTTGFRQFVDKSEEVYKK